MGTRYVRRFRMEIDLAVVRLSAPELPEGYYWTPWDETLLERHAAVKHVSFHSEIDSLVFSCLADLAGCQRLMQAITRQKSFLPAATWLISRWSPERRKTIDCGTIQGLSQTRSLGAVQNVGVVPAHRGQGLGRALMLKALHGFRRSLRRRVYLEVTADNTAAVELYRSIGFRLARTMYKAVEIADEELPAVSACESL